MTRLPVLVRCLVVALAVAGCNDLAAGRRGDPGGSGAAGGATGQPAVATAGLGAPGTAAPAVGLPAAGLPTLIPDAILSRVPTRVRVPTLGIDLAVVAPPPVPDHYPYCNVAEFIPALSRPGRPGATFLYAHARPGMFLPILERSRIDDGLSMVGLEVEVYTSDDRRFDYRVDEVRRHVTSLDAVYRTTAEELVLQTSEGPHGTIPKTMLVATPDGESAADHADAHPEAHPITCG